MVFDLNKFILNFKDETREHLKTINDLLVKLEKTPEEKELLNLFFRSVHTIKGSATMLHLGPIAELAHKIEDICDALRNQEIVLNSSLIDLLFQALDRMADMVEIADQDEFLIPKEEPLLEQLETAIRQKEKTPVEESLEETSGANETKSGVNPKILNHFFTNTMEQIASMNIELVSLEKEFDKEALDSIFRSAHGIKGAARIVKLPVIAELAHEIEDVLNIIKNEEESPPNTCDTLLLAVDKLTTMLKQAKAGERVEPADKELIKQLSRLAGKAQKKKESEPKQKQLSQPENVPQEWKNNSTPNNDAIRVSIEKLDKVIKLVGEMVSNQNRMKHRLQDIRKAEHHSHQTLKVLKQCETLISCCLEDRAVITQVHDSYQQMIHLLSDLRQDINNQELLTNELQDKALKLRMMPLSTIFDTFHRSVRDLSRSMSKEVNFTVEGGETKLDNKMIEYLGGPLLHMIRNAIDHGVENPEIRKRQGKPPVASIKLSACYESGSVLIQLEDDGAGISKEKIKRKAIEKRIYDQKTMDRLSDQELIELIFHPGITTVDKVTDISGRGVGMDIVRRNIVVDLKGAINIETTEGAGTRFIIRLPLTLSILNLLLVSACNMLFAFASRSIREVLKVKKTELVDSMGRKAFYLRNDLIPIERLETVLKIPGYEKSTPTFSDINLVLVLRAGDEMLGLVIDSLLSEEEMVIKPLPDHMKNNRLVTGVVITGKNELVNVLHVPTVLQVAKALTIGERNNDYSNQNREKKILVVDDSQNTREIEKNVLENYGFEVHLAENGADGLNQAYKTLFDLVITDYDMPVMDGLSFIKQLRTMQDYKERPIIIISSRTGEEDRKQGKEAGANAFITKSEFNRKTLIDTIENLI